MDNLHGSFGYEDVTQRERKLRISKVFASIAERYDLMNDLMSFGIHRLWKRRLVRNLTPDLTGTIVDLAGGTGDVAIAVYNKTGNAPVVIDASWQMMAAGRRKHDAPLTWITGEGENLPIAANSVELLTLSFGLRNMTDVDATLKEILRCLKPGGQFVCLEFSRPAWWLKPFYDLYSWAIIPRLGAFVAREPAAYQYLVESIRRFPEQQELCNVFEEIGFCDVCYRNLSFGISAIHMARKPDGDLS